MLPGKKALRDIEKNEPRQLRAWNKNAEFIATTFTEEDILILDFYDRTGYIYARVFQTKDDFTTLDYKKNRFIKSRFTFIKHIICFDCWDGDKNVEFESEEDENTVIKFTKKKGNVFQGLLKLQEEIMYQRRLDKENKKFEQTDEAMNKIEPGGENFENWVIDISKRKNTWLYKKKGKIVCSNCGDIDLEAKANTTAICPKCGCKGKVTTAQCKAEGKYDSNMPEMRMQRKGNNGTMQSRSVLRFTFTRVEL